jgi:hypothetical protein
MTINTVYPGSGITYNLVVATTSGGTVLFAGGVSGSTAVTLVGSDDGSGRQMWAFVPVYGGSLTVPSYYNIEVRGGGAQGPYLSVTADGATVNLYTKDDGSGRQRWVLYPVAGSANLFNIKIQGGMNSGAPTYLSANNTATALCLTATGTAPSQQWGIWTCVNG